MPFWYLTIFINSTSIDGGDTITVFWSNAFKGRRLTSLVCWQLLSAAVLTSTAASLSKFTSANANTILFGVVVVVVSSVVPVVIVVSRIMASVMVAHSGAENVNAINCSLTIFISDKMYNWFRNCSHNFAASINFGWKMQFTKNVILGRQQKKIKNLKLTFRGTNLYWSLVRNQLKLRSSFACTRMRSNNKRERGLTH